MNKWILVVLWIGLLTMSSAHTSEGQDPDEAHGMGFENYFDHGDFQMASPGALKSTLYGYDNPALLHFVHQPDLAFHWTAENFWSDSARQGGFLGLPGFGFGFVRNDIMEQVYRGYRVAIGGGTDDAAAGLALNWYRGDTDLFDLKTNITLGTITRPNRYLSIGMTGTTTFDAEYYQSTVELAVRPTGTPMLTAFGDYAVNQDTGGILEGQWSAGVAVEALKGIRFTGRYIDDVGYTAGVQFSFGRSGISYQSHMDSDGHHRFNSYSVRAGAKDRNPFDEYFRKDDRYVNMSLQGSMPYQNYRYLDGRMTYLPILQYIHDAAKDPAVSGITINVTDMALDQAKTWEVRKALDDFRENDKKVIMYVESGGMNTLHLTSVADYVIMDPLGQLVIPGYVTGSTYLAELLESVGIGVDEFREMDYKSAFEMLSRTEMSDADREQRREIIDGFYNLVKDDVTRSRGLDGEDFDALIDRGISLSPRDLVDAGLVDTLARPDDIHEIIEKLEGKTKKRVSPGLLYTYQKPGDDRWGPAAKIAVLYAEGPTMNTTGIRARKLSQEIKKMRADQSVEAVVLRSDSPGGAALASDLVAEELRKTAEKKPVIVSMGSVAASGGYWISMYADSIVAAPNTITGSIGVAGGWFWDDGMSEHLRLNTDYVSRGESADLSFGPTLPLLGISLPNRALKDEERAGLINRMNELYDDFVEKVAMGRNMEKEEVQEVASGRIWSGSDAVNLGLVDELGSLYTAIEIAREKAGLDETDKIEIVEGPERELFSFSMFLGGLFHGDAPKTTQKDPVVTYLETMIEHNATPLVIVPFEYFSWMQYLKNQH